MALTPFVLAFCGFYVSGGGEKMYNDATQVVLMRQGTRTALSMQNHYAGPPSKFAMVVPVPVVLQKENVKTLPMDVFDKLDALDSPRLVEYWEQDPCGIGVGTIGHGGGGGTGQGFGNGMGRLRGAHEVTIEAQFTVGEYEVVILSATDSTALGTWLRDNKYNIPDGAETSMRPYVQAGMRFFVAKVDPTKVKFENGAAALSPLRFHYDFEKFELPVRLGMLNSSGTQDLIVHVLSPNKRYESVNYPNVTIPTNFDLSDGVKGQFPAFYAALFDATVAKNPGAVVTEYSWQASTCDPCPPSGAMDPANLQTLGGDVMPGGLGTAGGGGGFGRGRLGGMTSGLVLTRLHLRYTKGALADDIVFREAPPIVGGREMWTTTDDGGTREIEHGAVPSLMNNFQARYAIRHPWTGAIACPNPVRNVWGGPPIGTEGGQSVTATKMGLHKRGAFDGASFVKGEKSMFATPTAAATVAPVPSTTPPVEDAGILPAPGKRGCGCSDAGVSGTGVSVLVASLFLRRRRKKP